MKTSELSLNHVYTGKDGAGRFVVVDLERRWDRANFMLPYGRPTHRTFAVSPTSRGLLFLRNNYAGVVSDEKLLRLAATVRERVADVALVTDDPQENGKGALLLELLGGQVRLALINPATLSGTLQDYVNARAVAEKAERLRQVELRATAAANEARFLSLWEAIGAPVNDSMQLSGDTNDTVSLPLDVLERLMGAAK